MVPVLQGQEQKIEPLRVSVGNRPQMAKSKGVRIGSLALQTLLSESSVRLLALQKHPTQPGQTCLHTHVHTHNGRVVLGLLAEDSPSQTGGRCASGQGFSVSCLFIIKPASPQGTLMWWVLLRSVFYLPVLRFWTKAITNTLMLLLQNK